MNIVRVIPREGWAEQPIQPSAGSYWIKCNWIIKAVFALLAVVVVFAVVARGIHPTPWWMVWIPLSAFIVAGAYLMIIGAFAIRPYRAERRLGYTTWPTGAEIKGFKSKRFR